MVKKVTKQQEEYIKKNLICKRCGSRDVRTSIEKKTRTCRLCGNIWSFKNETKTEIETN